MTDFKNIKKKIAKNIFFYWIKYDFNKNLDLLEKYKLRKNIKKNLSQGMIDDSQIPDLVEYLAAFVISTYSNPEDIPKVKDELKEEAEFITSELIKAYEIAINNKECDLVEYLGIPKLEFTEEQKKLYEKKVEDISNNKNINLSKKDGDFKEKLDYVFNLIDKYYKENYKKFWRPGVKHYALATWYILYQCVNDVSRFSEELNIKYVDDGEQRCLFNYFNLYIHNILFTGELLLHMDIRKTIFAASAIHPAQDDYIDKNTINKESIDIINSAIKGENVQVDDENLKLIVDLINIIYKMYPADEHPKLVEILLDLNRWQEKSLMQKKKKDIDEKELLRISFMKGGYAFAFYGYIALGKMDLIEFRHFFGMGAIFQVMDDLHDIEIDLADGVETIWTKRINKNLDVDEAMYGVIGIQKRFEQITNTIKSLKRPVFLRRMELFAVRLDLVKFYLLNRKYFSSENVENFELAYNIEINKYLDEYKLQLDGIKTMDEFKQRLLDIKDSYVKTFVNGKNK